MKLDNYVINKTLPYVYARTELPWNLYDSVHAMLTSFKLKFSIYDSTK